MIIKNKNSLADNKMIDTNSNKTSMDKKINVSRLLLFYYMRLRRTSTFNANLGMSFLWGL